MANDNVEKPSLCEAAGELAEAEVQKARQCYEKLRQDATEQLRKVRETTVGDVINATLGLVKKYPAPGVIVAAAIGFFLGRISRRK